MLAGGWRTPKCEPPRAGCVRPAGGYLSAHADPGPARRRVAGAPAEFSASTK